MGAREPALGLRDRKKIRTRETIRSEAMRLIVANGYAHTTIEQIADAADIAPAPSSSATGRVESGTLKVSHIVSIDGGPGVQGDAIERFRKKIDRRPRIRASAC